MQNSNENISVTGGRAGTNSEYRRKRVKRLKIIIIIIAIIFLVLPTIFCIILSIQVSRLQTQMKDLVEIHSQYGLTYKEPGGEIHVSAAELPIITNDEINFVPEQIDVTENQNSANADNIITDEKNVNNGISANTDSNGIYQGKKIYLTFDDGPSEYTDDILDILDEYQVKATFFVIGKTDKVSKDLYNRIVEEGHTLGMHSYSHKYQLIYNSLEDFDKDFTKLWNLLYDTTGYEPSIYRFPGGSNNLVNKNGMEDFIEYLNKKSIIYYDWNVVNGDATGKEYTSKQLMNNVLNGVVEKNTSIVLMHDFQAKEETVKSLPGLLKKLITGGAEVLPLDDEVTPIQMIKADSIK